MGQPALLLLRQRRRRPGIDLLSASVTGLNTSGVYRLANGISDPLVVTTIKKKRVNSLYYTVNLAMKDYLYLDVSGRSDLGRSGEPNGYMMVDIDGTDLRWHFKPTKGTLQQQMRVYPPGRYASPHGGIVVNVWDADDSTRVEWHEDGNPRGAMEQFTDEDVDFRNTLAIGAEPTQTAHIFHCKPSPKTKTVTITLTNRFGETYTETLNL